MRVAGQTARTALPSWTPCRACAGSTSYLNAVQSTTERTLASTTDSTGSAALTTWAKETAIWEKDTHALTCPMVWNSATCGAARGTAKKTL